MSNPVILVLGAGPGIGASVARRFGREGYDVALVARSADRLEELGACLRNERVTAVGAALDLTDEQRLSEGITRLGQHAGHLDVLHFNPSVFRQKNPLELAPAELLEDLRLGVASLLTAVQAARPFLSAGSRIVATGSMAADRPWNQAASLGVQKAALRNLVRSLDTTLVSEGIRAMSLTVNGTLAPDTRFSPDLVAEAIYATATRPVEEWRVEVSYDG
ncbi:MAG: SDR family oxidoreductase [Actinomycetota bacterium]|nr:SDR family oxidoreductase [Actinomycetota bacterium]